jgi:decaprenyl-phosphate phosphoribosyltransferase
VKQSTTLNLTESTLAKHLTILRVPHYFKNIYVFLPIFFSGQVFNELKFYNTLLSFASFSLMASCIYIINDICDIKFDRMHPVKKFRPIPSGDIGIMQACLISGILFVGSVVVSAFLSVQVVCIVLLYFILNIFYSFRFKNIAIVDVSIISIGFVLRIVAGSLASDISSSKWLVIMVFLLSMFQAFSKRMDDLYQIDNNSNIQIRKSLSGYNIEFLKIVMSMLTGVLMVCYIMYSVSPEIIDRFGDESFYTAFFVLLGLLRYLQLTFVWKVSGSPVKVLSKDRFIQLCIGCWLFVFFVLIYLR